MTLVKYRKRPVVSLADDMDRLFNQLWTRPFLSAPVVDRDWVPAFDIRETKDEIILTGALPGLDKKDIEVTLHDGVLTIGGERKAGDVTEDETVHFSELRYGKFQRSFRLPTEVDEAGVDAKYKQGILTLTLKKLQPVEPEKTRIAIK